MEKDFYTAKEIIMGTRSEYQKNEILLKKLKDMVYSDDKEVKDFYFTIFKFLSYKEPEIICYFKQNEKTLRGLLWKLEMKLGTYIYGRENNEIKKDINGKYKIGNHHYDAFIKEGMEEKFEQLIQEILSSDFITKMGFDSLNKRGTPEDIYMMLKPNEIGVHTFRQENASNWLDYCPSKDMLRIYTSNKYMNDEMVHYLLNFKVPTESLSEYHRQIIDNNPSTYKPIEIYTPDKDIDKNRFNLFITEDTDKITLTKTKIRKR